MKGEKIAFFLTAGFYLCLFHEWTLRLVRYWKSPDFSYCFLIPIISFYIFLEIKKKTEKEISYDSPLPGYAFLLTSVVFFLIGRLGSLETFIYLSIWLAIVGCIGVFFGKQVLVKYWFPLFILAFIVPAPPFITRLMSFKLRLISTKIAAYVLQTIGIPCYREGNILDLGITKLQVVHACSGLRYVIPIVIISLVISYLYSRNLLNMLILSFLSIPIAVIGNATRLVLLAILSIYVSLKVVEDPVLHDFIGWFVFMLSAGLIFLINRILIKIFGKKEFSETEVSYPKKEPKIAFHAFFVSSIFVFLYLIQPVIFSKQIVPERKSFSSFPMRIGDWIGRRNFLPEKILKALWADDYLLADYYNLKTGDKVHLLISYYEKQTALHTAHAPLSCLLGSGFDLVSRRTLSPNAERWFPVVQLVLKKGDLIVLSNFWFDQRGRIITNEYLNKIYLFLDAILMRRTDGALVRVEMPLVKGQNIDEAQEKLDKFLSMLKNILLKNNYIPQ